MTRAKRGIKISPYLGVGDGGFTMTSFKKSEAKSQSTSAWTFFFHKPYICDWFESRIKAVERRDELNEL